MSEDRELITVGAETFPDRRAPGKFNTIGFLCSGAIAFSTNLLLSSSDGQLTQVELLQMIANGLIAACTFALQPFKPRT